MNDPATHDLVQRLEAFLEPGEIELAGIIVHTDFGRDEEIDVHEATVHIGDVIAGHAGVEDWYVYSGNDDPEFASNQHQGRVLEDDTFVWECQHLVRDGTFDIVMYYEASVDQGALVDTLETDGFRVTSVPSPDR